MPIDTYEFGAANSPLETYEWDDIWWDHPEKRDAKRILIIGDSISRGYRRLLRKLEGCDFYVDGIATSKAVDNETFYTLIDYYASLGLSYDAVFFNSGLHGWHLDDEGGYKNHYLAFAKYVKEKFPTEKFFITLTTPVRKADSTSEFGEENERVKVRNAVAASVARELCAKTVDLYSSVENCAELYISDGVHFTPEGYSVLASKIFEQLV